MDLSRKRALAVVKFLASEHGIPEDRLTGIVFLLLEKDNSFVRFHAMQSLVVFLGLFVLSFVLGWIPIIGFLNVIIFPLGVILWILLMIKAFQGEKYKLPWVGDFAEKQIAGTSV